MPRRSIDISRNFDHLLQLGMLNSGQVKQVIATLHEAERIYQISSNGAVILCRAALENLSVEFESQLQLDTRYSKDTKQWERIEAIRQCFIQRRQFNAARAWEQFSFCNSDWNKIAHANRNVSKLEALAQLKRVHANTQAICRELVEGFTGDDFVEPIGILDELSAAKRAGEELRELARHASERAAHAESAQLGATQDLERVKSEREQVERDHQELAAEARRGVHDDSLKSLLLASEQNFQRLAAQQGTLETQATELSAQRAIAERQVNELQQQIERMRDESRVALDELDDTSRILKRMRRYTDNYPGVEGAADFFYQSLHASDGPEAPFAGFTGVCSLEGDLYADRYEVTLQSQPCTLRTITARSDRSVAECCSAWSLETRNYGLITQLAGSRGLATMLQCADPDKPGYGVFTRPSGRLLREYGRGGRGVSLRLALLVTRSFIEQLRAREAGRLAVSWPDLDAVCVADSGAILLDPCAVHFGNIGPDSMRSRPGAEAQDLSAEQLDRGWTFTAVHAMLRLLQVLPTGEPACNDSVVPAESIIASQFDILRKSADRPISAQSVRDLVKVVHASVQSGETARPRLASLCAVISAVLDQRESADE